MNQADFNSPYSQDSSPTVKTHKPRVVEPILIGADPDGEINDLEAVAILRHVRQLSMLLDSAFVIPGTTINFGLDTIIGLVPVLGDFISAVASGYIILLARKCGVSKWTAGRMVANSLVDFGVGSIPLVGDAFDVAWKSNRKNVALLERHLHKRFPHLKNMVD
jgi:hypothetical protein